MDAVSAHPFVNLVTGEHEKVRVVDSDVLRQFGIRKSGVGVAGESGDDDGFLVNGIAADGAAGFVPMAVVIRVADSEGDVLGVVPVFDSEKRCPTLVPPSFPYSFSQILTREISFQPSAAFTSRRTSRDSSGFSGNS